MYLPPQFKAKDQAHACDLMRAHPFASLISNDDEGFPFVTHLPLHLVEEGDHLSLLGHVAKPNPHAKYLRARSQALVCFMGPYAYMSPTVYPDAMRVPTWSYLAVHCKVEVTLIEDEFGKDRLLKTLIGDHEPAYAAHWKGLPEDFQRKMLAGILGFELKVTDLQAKLKLNQHRPESHLAMHTSYAGGGDNKRALAQWMERLGMVTPAAGP
jgi:transcriptional regulator